MKRVGGGAVLAALILVTAVSLAGQGITPGAGSGSGSGTVSDGAAGDLVGYTGTNTVGPLETGVAVGCGAGCLKFNDVTMTFVNGVFTIQDATPTTGVTQLVVAAGAAQSSNFLIDLPNSGFRANSWAAKTNQSLDIRSAVTGGAGYSVGVGATARTTTSGVAIGLENYISFQPSSGTATWAAYSYTGTINQIGGANGITRGLYVNPTLTAAADWRGIEVADGKGVIKPAGYALADLPTTAPDGSLTYCSDCTEGTAACTGSGTGTMAFRLNGAWKCY
jgi:hypothetical protein